MPSLGALTRFTTPRVPREVEARSIRSWLPPRWPLVPSRLVRATLVGLTRSKSRNEDGGVLGKLEDNTPQRQDAVRATPAEISPPLQHMQSTAHMGRTPPTIIAMSTSKPRKSAKLAKTPSAVGEFTILPLTLPTLPGLPQSCSAAKHYLYIRPHAPSLRTSSTDRSLFIANAPFDASESNIRTLFAEDLGGLRVESVEFDSSIPAAPTHKRFKEDAKKTQDGEGTEMKGKKRKRDEEVVAEGVVEDEESALPRVWSGELRRSGGCAVVIFVDKESRKGAMREVQKTVKTKRTIQWSGGDAGVVGVEREFCVSLPWVVDTRTRYMLNGC
jgi:hypothetical protein